MKLLKKALPLFFLFFLLFFGLSETAVSQPDTPGFGLDDNQESGPIGPGLTILLALGAAYGAIKMKRRRPPDTL